MSESEIKQILLPSCHSGKQESRKCKVEPNKIPKKRKVTDEKKWSHSSTLLKNTEQTMAILHNILHKPPVEILQGGSDGNATVSCSCPMEKLVLSQIASKIASYRCQDIEKDILDKDLFVNVTGVVRLLYECGLKCHFCSEDMQLLYEYVREPKQWSLDRIDNSVGHNSDNVYAACLSCNLRRKTIHHDRFFFTKQVRWVKSGI